jgi:hypothetical protein
VEALESPKKLISEILMVGAEDPNAGGLVQALAFFPCALTTSIDGNCYERREK